MQAVTRLVNFKIYELKFFDFTSVFLRNTLVPWAAKEREPFYGFISPRSQTRRSVFRYLIFHLFRQSIPAPLTGEGIEIA